MRDQKDRAVTAKGSRSAVLNTVNDISHEGLRLLLQRRACPFQAVKTWKESTDRDFEAKQNRILELYSIADRKQPGTRRPDRGDVYGRVRPTEFATLPGKHWAAVGGKHEASSNPGRFTSGNGRFRLPPESSILTAWGER